MLQWCWDGEPQEERDTTEARIMVSMVADLTAGVTGGPIGGNVTFDRASAKAGFAMEPSCR